MLGLASGKIDVIGRLFYQLARSRSGTIRAIVELAGNRRLIAQYASVESQIRIYIRSVESLLFEPAAIILQHEAIARAITEGDVGKASLRKRTTWWSQARLVMLAVVGLARARQNSGGPAWQACACTFRVAIGSMHLPLRRDTGLADAGISAAVWHPTASNWHQQASHSFLLIPFIHCPRRRRKTKVRRRSGLTKETD